MKKVTPVIFSRVLILLNLSRGGTLGTYYDNGIATLRCCFFSHFYCHKNVHGEPTLLKRETVAVSQCVCAYQFGVGQH